MNSDARAARESGLWAHENLFAWGTSVDAQCRSVEEQAKMLNRLGITQIAYSWQGRSVSTLDRELEMFQRFGISIFACAVTDANTPEEVIDWQHRQNQALGVEEGRKKPSVAAMTVGEMLEAFKRHQVTPQLWLIRNMLEARVVSCAAAPFEEWTDDQKNEAFRNCLEYDPVPPERQHARVRQEAKRIEGLAQIADSYGLKLGLYKHGGWIGITANQVAIVEHLRTRGVNNVGIVYQFIHAHDEVDDTIDFSATWAALQPYAMAVNITGLHAGRTQIYPILYPSQGDVEVGMMRVIQDSGWQGAIGVSAEKGGDAEENLRNNLIGLDWTAAELKHAGSGGTRPFATLRSRGCG